MNCFGMLLHRLFLNRWSPEVLGPRASTLVRYKAHHLLCAYIMCMCIYIYNYVYIYIYVDIYSRVCKLYIDIDKHTNKYLYVYVQIHTYIHTYIHKYRCAYTYMYICT